MDFSQARDEAAQYTQENDAISNINPPALSALSGPTATIKKLCLLEKLSQDEEISFYVSKKNLVLIVLEDKMTVKIYSTVSFKPLKVKKCPHGVMMIKYFEECDKIVFGGNSYYYEICNSVTFQTEAIAQFDKTFYISDFFYEKEDNKFIIQVTSEASPYETFLDILSLKLERLSRIEMDSDFQIYRLLKLHREFYFILALNYYSETEIHLYNIETQTIVDIPEETIDDESSIGLITRASSPTVTCLVQLLEEDNDEETAGHELVQYSLDEDNEKLVCYKIGPEGNRYLDLNQIVNSNYFTAIPKSSNNFPIGTFVLLNVTQNHVQTIKIIKQGDLSMFSSYSSLMTNGSFVMVGTNKLGFVGLYRVDINENEEDYNQKPRKMLKHEK